MNKIAVSDEFEQNLKARLEREQARINSSTSQKSTKSRMYMFVAASTAAVVLLTVVLSYFSITKLMNKEAVYQTDYITDEVVYNGYTTFSVAEDMSYRLPSGEETVQLDSNIHFMFEGFDEYGIDLRESCILFDSELDKSYTLANFFFDYYDIITQQNGHTMIDNGLLESFFGIKDNSNQSISVYDEFRGELVDLDSVFMSEYENLDEIKITVKVSQL